MMSPAPDVSTHIPDINRCNFIDPEGHCGFSFACWPPFLRSVILWCFSLGCDEQNNSQGGQGDRCLRKLKQNFPQIITINVLSVKIDFFAGRIWCKSCLCWTVFITLCLYSNLHPCLSLVYVIQYRLTNMFLNNNESAQAPCCSLR